MVQIGNGKDSQRLCYLNVTQEKETLTEASDRESYVTSIYYQRRQKGVGEINRGTKTTTGIYKPQPNACLLFLHSQVGEENRGRQIENCVLVYKREEKKYIWKNVEGKKKEGMFGKIYDKEKELNFQKHFEVQQANEGVDLKMCKLRVALIFQMTYLEHFYELYLKNFR